VATLKGLTDLVRRRESIIRVYGGWRPKGALPTKTGETHFTLEPDKRSKDLQEFLDRKVLPR